MADIELIIKIPEEQYKFIKQSMTIDKVKDYPALLYDSCEHIANGMSLPKGHGRLIDADVYAKKFNTNINGRIGEEYINASTIIEADDEYDDNTRPYYANEWI